MTDGKFERVLFRCIDAIYKYICFSCFGIEYLIICDALNLFMVIRPSKRSLIQYTATKYGS